MKLERSWRNQPLPTQAHKPKAKFLKKIVRLEHAPTVATPHLPFRPARWLAAVAAILVVGAGAVILLVMPSQIQASDTDVIDNIIAWNTKLSSADADERKQLLKEEEDTFRKRLKTAKVSEEERATGELLLDAGRKLALSDDLVEDEEIIAELADILQHRAKIAARATNKKDSERAGNSYTAFLEKAVNPLQSKLRVIDRLLEWNMDMANADAKTRLKLLANEEALRKEIQNAKLPADENATAEKLLELGRKLALNTDPVGEFKTVSEVADKLLDRAESAEKKGKTKESERFGGCYDIFLQKTFIPISEKMKAMQSKGPSAEMKKIGGGGTDYAKQKRELEQLWKNAPQFTRPDSHKKYEGMSKKGFPGFGGFPPFGGPSFGRPKGFGDREREREHR
jgi:hypothetical protein